MTPLVGAGELAVMLLAGVSALVPFVLWLALIFFAVRVGRRYPVGSVWRRLWVLPIASMLAQILGVGATALMLTGSFAGVAGAPVATRAEVLASGISSAMNATALGLIVSVVLLVASVVLVAMGFRRAPAASRPPSA